jgi:putative oxidoreductase
MTTAQRYAATIVRITLGVIFFAHGAQKVLGWFGGTGWSGTLEAFGKQGMPAPMTILVMIAEFVGGLGVLVGCLTRVAAFGPAIVMAGAIFLVHLQNGFFLNWFLVPGRGHGIECNLAYLAMAVSVMLVGPGALSIDGTMFGRRRSTSTRGLAGCWAL